MLIIEGYVLFCFFETEITEVKIISRVSLEAVFLSPELEGDHRDHSTRSCCIQINARTANAGSDKIIFYFRELIWGFSEVGDMVLMVIMTLEESK